MRYLRKKLEDVETRLYGSDVGASHGQDAVALRLRMSFPEVPPLRALSSEA